MPAYQLAQAIPQENREELLAQLEAELAECTEVQDTYRHKIRKFMEANEIWHISELDYPWREAYEEYLAGEVSPVSWSGYLKAFDRVKQHSLRNQAGLKLRQKNRAYQYENRALYLPYHPDQKLAERFDQAQKKKDLLWDFSRAAPETMKRQIFNVLHYLIKNEPDGKQLRRRMVALRKFYDFCIAESIRDIEQVGLEEIGKFRDTVSTDRAIERTVGIIDYCRKAIFLEADEIHWDADIWYMERFRFQPERLDPSSPVQSLSFLEVTHEGNRKLLKKYLRYGLGITNLSLHFLQMEMLEIRKFLTGLGQVGAGDACQVTEQQFADYFNRLQEKPIKADTYNKQVMSILHFYSFLVARGYMEKVPFYPDYYLKKSMPQHHDRSVDEETVAEVFQNLYRFPEELRLMFLHLWGVGLRISEVCTLKGDAYYIQGRDAWIQVYQIKMRTYKRIPIPAALYKLMQVYMKRHGITADAYVFQNSRGGAYRKATFRKHIIECCDKCSIQGGEYLFKAHDYRHTLATYFYNDGVSLQGVRDYLGHDYEEMTEQYIDYMPKKIEKANEEFFAQPGNSLAACIRKEGWDAGQDLP